MTEGVFRHKDTKFHYARVLLHPTPSGAPSRREPSFDLCEHRGRAHYVRKKSSRMKVFAELFSKSDHKNTSAYHSTNAKRTMCVKTFQYESFLRSFFQKATLILSSSAVCAYKNFPV